MDYNYRQINRTVMTDTVKQIRTNPKLAAAVSNSISKQFMVAEEDSIEPTVSNSHKTTYLVSGKRSFEAAKGYPGKKVAVLNFANNHCIGGAPFSAGAQEESLCRCSTLYPCLQAMEEPFYIKHATDYQNGKLTYWGNDDLIYTPEVVVFKTDERTDPIYPQMMSESEWYAVDVITCAAPELRYKPTQYPDGYEALISKRIKKIIDVAAKEKADVLILGAWGCGAFGNSIDVVAKCFLSQLPHYGFETVEFAMSSGDGSNNAFAREIEKMGLSSVEKTCINDKGLEMDAETRFFSVLGQIKRAGICTVLDKLKQEGFFAAPASVVHHSNWEGGLVDHSLKVYDCAMNLRAERIKDDSSLEARLPAESVAIAALLHDVCKTDRYTIGTDAKPHHKKPRFPIDGHGSKSVILLQMWGLVLNEEEVLAIRWHMGKADIPKDDRDALSIYQTALDNHPLVKLIVNADYNSTH